MQSAAYYESMPARQGHCIRQDNMLQTAFCSSLCLGHIATTLNQLKVRLAREADVPSLTDAAKTPEFEGCAASFS